MATILNQSPVRRLAAEGRILAGFLTEDAAASLPEFCKLPLATQNDIRAKFGAASRNAQSSSLPVPRFRHVDEPEAINVLAGAAAQCGGPTRLDNLVGFEWVEIATILAGHYIAMPMPVNGRLSAVAASITDIVRYCMVGMPVLGEDLVIFPGSGDIVVPERLRLRLNGLGLGPDGLAARYSIDQEPSPVTIWFVDDRAIAVRHQERLVGLLEAGVTEALCLVCFGYGLEVLQTMPTITAASFESYRPPYVSDFCNEEMMVRIPVPTPKTLLRFSHQVIDLAIPN